MPVRKIPKNYRNVTGVAAPRKSSGKAMFESTLERDFIALLEFDPTIDRFEVQPITIEWLDLQNKARHYTPDVLATSHHEGKTHSVLYEIKYREDLRKNWAEFEPKFRAAIHYAKQHGWRFKIVTELEVRTPYLDNAKFLLPFIRQGPAEEVHMDILVEKLRTTGKTTPADILKAIFLDEWNQAKILPTLWYLVGTRQIGIDLEAKITMASSIWSINT